MNRIKQILASILSLILLLAPISVNFCFAGEHLTVAGQSVFCCEENHPDHHQTTFPDSHNRAPCQSDHSCCHFATQGATGYLSLLDSYPLSPSEILFQPLEIAKSFYHPPRARL